MHGNAILITAQEKGFVALRLANPHRVYPLHEGAGQEEANVHPVSTEQDR